jgi:hypothetical protein
MVIMNYLIVDGLHQVNKEEIKGENKLKYLIVEPKVAVTEKAPNIALMKWARWCEQNNHEYIYVKGCVSLTDKVVGQADCVREGDYYPDVILISMIFTYFFESYEKTIDFYYKLYPNAHIKVGGVFPSLFPTWFDKLKWNGVIDVHKGMSCEIEDIPPKYNVDIIYESDKAIYGSLNSIVMYASRGCDGKCPYCVVPRLEGAMNSFKSIKDALEVGIQEVPDARVVVLYDNNFTRHEYFDQIVSELVDFGLPVDIHGLHVDAFDKHKAEQFAKLKWGSQGQGDMPYLRFSFDKLKYADNVERALQLVKDANIRASFFAYMLFNFTDTPEDFWWRIMRTQEMVDRIGKTVYLFPQRYVPLKPVKKNSFIGKHWDDELLRGLKRVYTDSLHNFLPVTRSRNLYNYIGDTYDEFIEKIRETGKRVIKEEEDLGLTEEEIGAFF